MLDIDMKPIRGILFVRLSGYLNKNNTQKLNNEVLTPAKKVEVRNILFNLEEVKSIDKYGKKALINGIDMCNSNSGSSFICIKDNHRLLSKIKPIVKKTKIVHDELSAVNIINL